nr:hypothetical protein [uncultured Roseococcus sp.]
MARDPTLADRSPYYRRIYEERLARTLVQRRGNEVFSNYWQSPLAGSADPNAVQGWLEEQFRDTLDGLAENPTALAAASEELRGQATQLTRTHTQNAAQNLVRRNEDSFNSAVGTAFDEAAQRRQPVAALTERLQGLEAEARAQGVDGRQINTILSAQLGEAIVRHNRSDFAEVGRANRPDRTPGFATTAQGRQAIASAQDRVHAAAVRASNLAYTQEMRARARAGDEAMRGVATAFAQSAQSGDPPTITPQQLQQLASIDPALASRALELQRGMRSFADERNVQPGLVAVTEAQSGPER